MRLFILLLLMVFLIGCANNTEHIAKAMEDRQPQQCSFTDRWGDEQRYEGPICENIARAQMMNACAGLAEDKQGMCVVAVALGNANGNGNSRTSDDVRLLIAAMQSDTQIKSAWIGQIPIIGTLASVHYSYKSDKAMFDMLENGLSTPSTMNITQSNDGGGVGGEAGGGGRGGDGDLIVLNGDSAQSLNRSDGSVISSGRNPTILGTGEQDSTFDPPTVNNQNSTGPENPITNAPFVSNQDSDGSGDFSIIPGL